MSDLEGIVRELVIANRILANEDVVDAYGHVSLRHPDDLGGYLLARSVAPELVERGDIVEFTLDGTPTREEKRALLLGQPQGGIGGDGSLAVHDCTDATGRNRDVAGEQLPSSHDGLTQW